jgi:hypothetical protein
MTTKFSFSIAKCPEKKTDQSHDPSEDRILFFYQKHNFSEFVKTCDEHVLGLVRVGIVNGHGGNAVGQF